MRTLLLMRHAKSDWTLGHNTDKERSLNLRGQRDAPRMAAWLVGQDLLPGVALVSDAQRTVETWGLMKSALGEVDAAFSSALYHAGPEDMLDAINGVQSDAETLILIAHQPGMAALTRMLSGKLARLEYEAAYGHFPTAGIAVLKSEAASWHDVAPKSCEFVGFQRPKDL